MLSGICFLLLLKIIVYGSSFFILFFFLLYSDIADDQLMVSQYALSLFPLFSRFSSIRLSLLPKRIQCLPEIPDYIYYVPWKKKKKNTTNVLPSEIHLCIQMLFILLNLIFRLIKLDLDAKGLQQFE